MKKRLVLLLVTAMAATTVLAGCGSKDSGSSDSGKKSAKVSKVENDDDTSILILHRKYVIEMIGNW